MRAEYEWCKFKSNTNWWSVYRSLFNRDIYKDLAVLEKAIDEGDENASNLDLLTIGLVNEMFIESRNDGYPWAEVGDQQAMDAF